MLMLRKNDDFFGINLSKFFNDDFFGIDLFDTEYNSISSANIKNNGNDYSISMIVAGIPKEKIKLEVENDILKISAKYENELSDDKSSMVRREYTLKTFSRSFKINKDADVDKIEADVKDGILNIKIPKKELKKSDNIQIQIK